MAFIFDIMPVRMVKSEREFAFVNYAGTDLPDVDSGDLCPEAEAKGRKQYPLVLMLEPLFRCNLACAGCGKIQYPAHVLKKNLSPEECFQGRG